MPDSCRPPGRQVCAECDASFAEGDRFDIGRIAYAAWKMGARGDRLHVYTFPHGGETIKGNMVVLSPRSLWKDEVLAVARQKLAVDSPSEAEKIPYCYGQTHFQIEEQ